MRNILQGIPDQVKQCSITNIIWDAAIAYFTVQESEQLLTEMASVLREKKGILSGQTPAADTDGDFHQHKKVFGSKEELSAFLSNFFENVLVFETVHEDRHNLYFYASDGDIPMTRTWENAVSTTGREQ